MARPRKVIPQCELRNRSGAVLRQVERGDSFVVTVGGGRPVATLGPYERRHWVSAGEIRELLATPTDETVLEDLAEFAEDLNRRPV